MKTMKINVEEWYPLPKSSECDVEGLNEYGLAIAKLLRSDPRAVVRFGNDSSVGDEFDVFDFMIKPFSDVESTETLEIEEAKGNLTVYKTRGGSRIIEAIESEDGYRIALYMRSAELARLKAALNSFSLV